MKEIISIAHFKALLKRGISLNEIYLLALVKEGINVSLFLSTAREKALYNGMLRKLLITEQGTLSPAGEEALNILSSDVEEIELVKEEEESRFEEWWAIYPPTNSFEYKGRVFKGTQRKNLDKAKCKELFDRYVKLKLFRAEDIINATQYHIQEAKELSLKRGENQLTYVPGSLRYLQQKYFEPFIGKTLKKTNVTSYSTEG